MTDQLVVLRLGHRIPRDSRITTHVCLTARAFGADGLVLADVADTALEQTIQDVTRRFGGTFWIKMGQPWRQVMRDWKAEGGDIVHLTAYGVLVPQVIDEIRASLRPKLVVIGAEKVPGEAYELATWNVAITNQPISEVSALAVFLDRYLEGRQFSTEFSNAEVRIIPSARGKQVVNLTKRS